MGYMCILYSFGPLYCSKFLYFILTVIISRILFHIYFIFLDFVGLNFCTINRHNMQFLYLFFYFCGIVWPWMLPITSLNFNCCLDSVGWAASSYSVLYLSVNYTKSYMFCRLIFWSKILIKFERRHVGFKF